MKQISIHQYLEDHSHLPLIDVRSPIEYNRGHIPGSFNLPLFTNEERAFIGLTYKEKGREVAIDEGLSIAGAKMRWYVDELKNITREKAIAIHCWRGGRRSNSLAWLFTFVGFKVYIIEKGYKAYRNYVLKMIGKADLNLIVLGGKTGSGKTEVLRCLQKKGAQIIDLEDLANHKGSAFGSIDEDDQPSSEHFENQLHKAIYQLDHQLPIWVENESKGIGRVYIPDPFWKKMKSAPLIHIEIPLEVRAQYLASTYGKFDKEKLKAAFKNIQKRIGNLALSKAIESIDQQNFVQAAEIALHYYDKTYQHGLEKNASPDISIINIEEIEITKISGKLLAIADERNRN